MMKSTIYKELHSKCGISSVCFYSDGDCDATQWAWTECPQQYNKKSFCLKETWDKKTHFLSCLHFIAVFTNFLPLSARGSIVPDFFTVTLTHSSSVSWKNLAAAPVYQHMPSQIEYSFFHKVFCFVFHFSPMFRDCQSLIWKKSKQTKKSLKITKQANTKSFLLSGH